jgi:PIN domain nuclease of toxin-antitoxin system
MNPVLDASALLAYLHREPGWESVREAVGEGYVGAVNWCEVAQKAALRGLDVSQVRGLLEDVGLTIVPFTAEQAEAAAVLWPKTRNHGLSLADRACLALALERKAPVFTADRAWAELDLGLNIRVVR